MRNSSYYVILNTSLASIRHGEQNPL